MSELSHAHLNPSEPWPGLAWFEEADQPFFRGRADESAELIRLVRREPLTVLFGRSGLGKTSLLKAGLFPALRAEDFLPVYLRLEHASSAPPLRDQVFQALANACESEAIQTRKPPSSDELWTFFHSREVEFWSVLNRPVMPVIVFDQFEEIFTLGQEVESLQQRSEAFLNELADLVESRPPAAVKQQVEQDPSSAALYEFRRPTVKLVLSFREDFLAEIERLKPRMPSLMINRLRLLPMNGAQAYAVITEAGGALVDDEVARRLLRLAWKNAPDPPVDPAEFPQLEIDPALLSVVCRELNSKRLAAQPPLPRITADLMSGADREILKGFYERGMEGLDPGVRTFVEEELITQQGYRDSHDWDDALVLPGVTQEALEQLIRRRLVRAEDRQGRRRLELTHDVLAKVVKNSRDQRRVREAEARRRAEQERLRQAEAERELDEANRARFDAEFRERSLRRWMIGMSAMSFAVGVLFVFAFSQLRVAKKAQGRAFAATATALLSAEPVDPLGAVVNGLAAMGTKDWRPWQKLADDPGESIPLTVTLTSAVRQNLQISAIQTSQGQVRSLLELKNGELISGGSDGTIRRWKDGQVAGDPNNPIKTRQGAVLSMLEMKNGELISGGKDGTIRRWKDGQEVGDPNNPIKTRQGAVLSMLEMKNGELISGGKDGTIRRWKDGQELGDPNNPIKTDQGAVLSLLKLKNSEVISGGSDGTIRRWKDGLEVGDRNKPIKTGQGAVWSLLELKNGKLKGQLMSGHGSIDVNKPLLNGTIRIWKNGEPMDGGKPIQTGQDMVLSLLQLMNGELISGGGNGTIRRWRIDEDVIGNKAIATDGVAVWSLTELENGDWISGGSDGMIRRWRTANQQDELNAMPSQSNEVLSLVELKNGELISGDKYGTIRRWKDGQPVGDRNKPITTGESAVLSLLHLKNGEHISGDKDGTIRRWKGGQEVVDRNYPIITTGKSAVLSLMELKNGELISGSKDGTIRRWKDGQELGDPNNPIKTGQGAVLSLLELRNGELISGGQDGTIQRWRNFRKDGVAIPTNQGAVTSMARLGNEDLITGGADSTIRLWRAYKAISGRIPTGQLGVNKLVVLHTGGLISGGKNGSLKRFVPEEVISAGCLKIKNHPALLSPETDAEKQASEACRSRGYLKRLPVVPSAGVISITWPWLSSSCTASMLAMQIKVNLD